MLFSDIFSMLFFAVCLPVFKRFLGYISVAYWTTAFQWCSFIEETNEWMNDMHNNIPLQCFKFSITIDYLFRDYAEHASMPSQPTSSLCTAEVRVTVEWAYSVKAVSTWMDMDM